MAVQFSPAASSYFLCYNGLMEPPERILLEQTVELVKDNNRLLHKIVNAQRWAKFWSALKWLIIVGTTVGAYYFLQPYLDKMLALYQGVFSSLPDLNAILPH